MSYLKYQLTKIQEKQESSLFFYLPQPKSVPKMLTAINIPKLLSTLVRGSIRVAARSIDTRKDVAWGQKLQDSK